MTPEEQKGLSLSGGPGEYIFLTEPKPTEREDYSDKNLTFDGLLAFVTARAQDLKSRAEETMFEVDVEQTTITLQANFYGGSDKAGRYDPQLTLEATTKKTADATLIDGMMNRTWDSDQLADAVKKVPYLFVGGDDECKRIIKALRNFKVSVRKIVEATTNVDTNERSRKFESEFVDKPSDLKWSWNYAIYVGTEERNMPCELVYELNDSGTGVNIILRDPTKVPTERQAKKDMMQKAVKDLQDVVGPTIPFVHVN